METTTAGDAQTSEKHGLLVAEVAVDATGSPHGSGVLSYGVPAVLTERISVGQLVWAPLRKQVVLGIVVRLHRNPVPSDLRALQAPVEPAFHLDSERMEIAGWVARETASTLFAALAPFLPPGVSHRAVEFLRLTKPDEEPPPWLTFAQKRVVDLLAAEGEMTIDQARKRLGSSLTTIVPKLEEHRLIERFVQVVDHAPSPKTERFIRLIDADPQKIGNAPKQRRAIEYLAQRQRVSADPAAFLIRSVDFQERAGIDAAVISALAKKGAIEVIVLPAGQAPDSVDGGSPPVLTPTQAAAWAPIEASLHAAKARTFLLQGVTGSGKTEVYLRAVAWCLMRRKAAIVLVPEIALATQVVRRFQSRFPGRVAVMHSELPDAERFATWQAVANEQLNVVVGPRSALFAPVRDLGLIVLDEEHEWTYKQESEPRYHARALAEEIARRRNAVVILGSATPSVESRWRAEQEEIHLLSLPARVGPARMSNDGGFEHGSLDLPEVSIVDMRLELHRGRTSILSQPLFELVGRTLERNEQTLLFLNRRGSATIVLCRSCGESLLCPFCDIPMVYHQDKQRLICHRCNHRAVPPPACPACGGGLNYFGAGTQRVEEEVKHLFPRARVLRWDQDAVRKAGGHQRLLKKVEGRQADIVVGTQMIAKGFDLPFVTAIGVVHADTLLHLPDFRSAERTFQLLTQVAGRAGRRTAGSRVVVQTYTPGHYAILAAAKHDYESFYADEIAFRRDNRYPPFTRLIRFLYRHPDEEKCALEADSLARALARHVRDLDVRADLLGPTPAFANKMRGNYQWVVVLRAEPEELDRMLDGLPIRPGWSVDVDPQSLL
jgi:primosomal protein N' (replication factor Y)